MFYNKIVILTREREAAMITVQTSLENLKVQHAYLDAAIRKEEQYVWKNLIKIEELKKQKLRQKDALLRLSLQIRERQ